MNKRGLKAVIYTRVSTEMQVDGFSLEGQKRELERLCEYEGMTIVKVYEEKGKSGKSVEGRPEFQRMLEDIETGVVNTDYVCVYKLSRFGRNASDILSTLERLKMYEVNLLSKEDNIDSADNSSKLIISLLGSLSEMERDNIIVQTMNGRKEKARQGGWNGGFAPYGYVLKDGELEIVPEEAEIVKFIFNEFVYKDKGYSTISKLLNRKGIKKRKAPNSTRQFDDWASSAVKHILDNPTYMGKIAYGRRTKQLKKGTRNQYETIHNENYILVDGKHEAIIDEKTFELAKSKRQETGKKFPEATTDRIHLISGILRCPGCGSPMYGNKNRWKNKNGDIQTRFYYSCGHNKSCKGGECSANSVRAEWLEEKIALFIKDLVKNEEFAKSIKETIGNELDTEQFEKDLKAYKGKLAQVTANKKRLETEIDNLPLDTPYRDKKLVDKNARLDSLYDEIEELETLVKETEEKKKAVIENVLTLDRIYKILLNFDKIYDMLEETEKRDLLHSLIKRIEINKGDEIEKRTLKSIEFNFAIPKGDCKKNNKNSLEEVKHDETVCLLSRKAQ